MKRAVGRPSRDQQEEISTRLLDAARAVFCRHGMSGASMEMIAAEAGVTKHTIYRRYDGKDHLLDAVVARELTRIAQFTRLPIASDRSPLDVLKALAQARFSYGLEPETVAWRAFLRAESTFSPTLLRKLAQWDEIAVVPFIEAIKLAQVSGCLRDEDPQTVCDILFSLIDGSERWWRWGGEGFPASRDKGTYLSYRWEAFLRACA